MDKAIKFIFIFLLPFLLYACDPGFTIAYEVNISNSNCFVGHSRNNHLATTQKNINFVVVPKNSNSAAVQIIDQIAVDYHLKKGNINEKQIGKKYITVRYYFYNEAEPFALFLDYNPKKNKLYIILSEFNVYSRSNISQKIEKEIINRFERYFDKKDILIKLQFPPYEGDQR